MFSVVETQLSPLTKAGHKFMVRKGLAESAVRFVSWCHIKLFEVTVHLPSLRSFSQLVGHVSMSFLQKATTCGAGAVQNLGKLGRVFAQRFLFLDCTLTCLGIEDLSLAPCPAVDTVTMSSFLWGCK